MAAQRRALFVVPVFILGSALAGGLLGSSGQAGSPTAPPPSSDSEVNASLESFSKIYDLVEDNNAEKVGPDKGIYKGAIPGMLRTLDPHSNFFDPKDFAGLREEQKGRYYGVGMSIQPQSKTGRTMVLAPLERVAGLNEDEAVWPLTTGSVSVISSVTRAGSSMAMAAPL